MLRGLLFLFIAAVAILAIRSLARNAALRRSRAREPRPEPAAPVRQLPAPEAAPAEALDRHQVFARLRELAFGLASMQMPQSAGHSAVAEATRIALQTVASEPRYAPRRPLLLPQLLRAVNDTEVSRREIATIIARDPALAGQLLKLANSPFYRVQAQPVESIDRAVALLGTDGIRSLIAAALVQPVFRITDDNFKRFAEISWEHTFRSAAAAEAHAAVVENADPFAAQLLGLVTGLAELIVFRVALDQYGSRGDLRPDGAVVASLIDAHSAEVARRIAESWDLSGRMLAALEDQNPGATLHEPTALGRSLSFGRLLGALAVLNANGRIDEEAAKAAVLKTGASAPQFERFWTRLTGRPPSSGRREHRPPSSIAY